MFCKNCGASLAEGAEFCTECGKKVEVEAANEQTTENAWEAQITESNSFPETGFDSQPPKKKASLKKFLIPAAAVVVLAVLFFSLKHTFVKLFLNSEDYLAYVVGTNLDDYADTFAEALEMSKTNMSKGSGAKANVTVEVEDEFAKVFEDITGEDLPEEASWFESAGVSMETYNKDAKMSMAMDMKLNGADMGTFDFIMDMAQQKMYYGIKDYNPDYLFVENTYDDSMSESYENMQKVFEALPKKALTKKLLTKYGKVVLKSIDEVEESTDEIEAGGVKQKVTKLTVDVDGELIKNISSNFLNEVKEDKEIKKIFSDILKASDADVDVDELWDELDEVIEEIEDTDADDFDIDAKFELYVNNKGEIVGCKFKVEDDYSEFKFECISPVKGNKFGLLVKIDTGYQTFKIEGSGKASGNKRTGELAVKTSGMTLLEADFKKVNTKLLKEGVFNGSVTLRLPEDVIGLISDNMYLDLGDELADVSVTLKSKSKSLEDCDLEITLDYKDKPCVKLTADAKTTGAKKVTMPKGGVDANDYEEMEEWLENLDTKKLIKKLEKAKLPDELVEELEDSWDF